VHGLDLARSRRSAGDSSRREIPAQFRRHVEYAVPIADPLCEGRVRYQTHRARKRERDPPLRAGPLSRRQEFGEHGSSSPLRQQGDGQAHRRLKASEGTRMKLARQQVVVNSDPSMADG